MSKFDELRKGMLKWQANLNELHDSLSAMRATPRKMLAIEKTERAMVTAADALETFELLDALELEAEKND